jgi:hypothetical protein
MMSHVAFAGFVAVQFICVSPVLVIVIVCGGKTPPGVVKNMMDVPNAEDVLTVTDGAPAA